MNEGCVGRILIAEMQHRSDFHVFNFCSCFHIIYTKCYGDNIENASLCHGYIMYLRSPIWHGSEGIIFVHCK